MLRGWSKFTNWDACGHHYLASVFQQMTSYGSARCYFNEVISNQSFYGPVIEKLHFAIYIILHHFLSISLDEQQSVLGHVLLLCKNCTIIVCTKLA